MRWNIEKVSNNQYLALLLGCFTSLQSILLQVPADTEDSDTEPIEEGSENPVKEMEKMTVEEVNDKLKEEVTTPNTVYEDVFSIEERRVDEAQTYENKEEVQDQTIVKDREGTVRRKLKRLLKLMWSKIMEILMKQKVKLRMI